MTDCCPSQIDLNLSNTGGADFVVVYTSAGDKLYFPFTSTPVQQLQFSGDADLLAANYDDPMMGGVSGTTTTRMIGKQVTISYVAATATDKDHARVLSVTGTLIQMDDAVAVVTSGAGTLALRSPNIVSVSSVEVRGEPTLSAQLGAPGQQLVVRGRDTQLRYSVQHNALLEPIAGESNAGSCKVRLTTHATINNGYRWPLEVRKLTLTEHEEIMREMQAEQSYSAAPMMMARQAASAESSPPPSVGGSSGQSGSIDVRTTDKPVELGRSIAPTVVMVGETRLTKARWHLLGSVDPTETGQESENIALDFVVRMNRDPATGFMLSGAASVQLDMDPLPGDDHLAPTSLPRGFYHDAWDKKNSARMYHQLGETMLVTLEACVTDKMREAEKHDTRSNSHEVKRTLKFANKTPYDAQCKLYIRTLSYKKQMTSVDVVDSKNSSRVRLEKKFVVELPDESDQPGTHTLLVVVPPKTDEFEVNLRAVYYTR